MPCYSPLTAYRARSLNESGKRGLVFNRKDGYADRVVTVPCGQCVGCRLERSRQWALRCVHEASLYPDNCFITLTYNQESVPGDFGLDKTAFPKFMKRFRKRYPGKTIRYFHCGEYGEKNLRPHYHACIFGFDFPDKILFDTRDNVSLYTSDILSLLWPYGFSTVGDVTFESAAYVARYVMKKIIINDKTPDHLIHTYERVDPVTGEFFEVEPEYTTMSRNPGIGKGWYEKFKGETYRDDSIIIRGKEMQPPKYYDNLYEIDGDIKKVKKGRRRRALKRKDNNTTERLIVREKVKKKQLKFLKRNLDED